MSEITIAPVTSARVAAELDELLWRILWQPLGLSRDIRKDFKVDGESIELVATKDGKVTGALVAVWTGDTEIELRHIAILPAVHNHGIGRRLVESAIEIVRPKGCQRIHTISRNTSSDFFRSIGFRTAKGVVPEHPVFKSHGIFFELMERIVEHVT